MTSLSGEIKTLIGFLNERRVPSRDNLEERLQSLSRSESELADRLRTITETLMGESDVAQQLREQLSKVDNEIRQLLVVKRDREKLLKRLLPLRGQYSEDIKKLQFLQEAKTIFDPLGLIRCLYYLELIEKKEAGYCNLCGRSMKAKPSESFDIKKEIRTIETKLRELNQFAHETDKELDEIKSQLEDKNLDSQNIRSRLDEAMKEYVSPYVSERDSVVGELNRVRQQSQDIRNRLNLHKGIETRCYFYRFLSGFFAEK